MKTDQRTSIIPRTPSNRHFIQQMVKWGWEAGRSDGTWLSMLSPEIGGGRTRVRVKPGTQHDANPTSVFMEVYRLTTQGDAELFWHGPSDMWLKMLGAAKVKAQTIEAVPPPKEAQVKRTPEHIPARDLIEVLSDHDGPMTVKMIGRKLDLDLSDPAVMKMVQNRAGYLVDHGMAERVMRGTYRISNAGKTIDARVQHDGIHRDPPKLERHDVTGEVRVATPQQGPPTAEVPAVRIPETMDDTIEAVLDLLLPQGFRATHLRFIAPWVEATRRMVEEVSKG